MSASPLKFGRYLLAFPYSYLSWGLILAILLIRAFTGNTSDIGAAIYFYFSAGVLWGVLQSLSQTLRSTTCTICILLLSIGYLLFVLIDPIFTHKAEVLDGAAFFSMATVLMLLIYTRYVKMLEADRNT